MAEILVLWMFGLIVIAIGWGVTDKITDPLKVIARSLYSPERSKRLEIIVASLLALAVSSIMVGAADNSMGKGTGLPTLLVWAGGLWLIPFRVDAIGDYWLSSLAVAVILVLCWVVTASYLTARAHAERDVSTQQGENTSVTGLGFLFWIFLIGITVAAIARYTSIWNAAALNS